MSNLVRCQKGHLFSTRTNGTVCPYCGINTVTEEKEAIKRLRGDDGIIKPLEQAQKVCGWLVCVEGIRSGVSYVIKEGKNFIGRGDDMDIQILGDDAINMSCHAIIAYDKKKSKFTLLPGSGNGLVYLDEEAVYIPTDISSYQKIEMGNSLFLFVEFVGNKFSWEEGLADQKKDPQEGVAE